MDERDRVTERKRAEEALKKHKEHLEALVEERTSEPQREISERRRLERQVEEMLERRTRQVQTSTEIAQEIAAATELDELFRRVVTLVKERFGYYHAQIFRHDPGRNAMVVVEGYGETGERMKAAGHNLPYGQGVVGTAAATGSPVLASDVSQDPHWAPHPDLPATKGELAVPIKLRDEVLGVLDVQSDQAGALTEKDQIMLLGLAGQIASAIESTSLFEQAQTARERVETLYGISRGLSAARDEDEILQVLARPAIKAGAFNANLLYIDLDETGEPEWNEIVSTWQRDSTPPAPVGTRHYLPTFPFARLWMSNANKAQLIADVATDERVDENLENLMAQRGIRAMAVIPLTQAGHWVGLIHLTWNEPHEFSEREEEIYHALVGLASPAVASRRLFGQTEVALARTEALYTGSERVARAATLDEVLQALVHSTALQQMARNSVLIFDRQWDDEPPQTMTVVAAWERSGDEPRAPIGTRYVLEQFPATRLFSRREPGIVHNVATDERLDENTRVLFLKQLGMRSMVIFPLVAGEQWIGVLAAQDNAVLDIDQAGIRQITSLTDQAAAVIQNLRLLEEVQARARREQILREITARVRGLSDTEAIVRTAVRELGAALGRSTFIRLGSAEELSQTPTAQTDGGDGRGITLQEGGE